MVISDSFHIAIRSYSIKVFTPFLDTFKWTSFWLRRSKHFELQRNSTNPQFLESPHFDFCCGLAKVADRWILVTMLQTKDHLFDCPAEFHHSPDTKTEPSDQAILRMEQQQTAAFVIYNILHSSHIHFSMTSILIRFWEIQKRCSDARLSFRQIRIIVSLTIVLQTKNVRSHMGQKVAVFKMLRKLCVLR